MTLVVQRRGPDTYHPDKILTVHHFFPVPPATFDRDTWTRWLFDRLGDVDRHERMEDFVIGGQRVLAPNHGPGRNPYVVHEYATVTDRRTTFRGELSADDLAGGTSPGQDP
jgi:hypothetical protein